ncbi:MAG: acetyltransferase [Chloroflexota bacterium]|nr:acetyltransferase [Chloroflexota bacterium]
MRASDTPLLRRWLLEPHVRRWWNDDPDERDYPDGTLAEWMTAIRGEDPTDMFVIHLDGRPIGVIQSYRVNDYPDYVAELGALPAAAISIDVFIGEPELIGKGHGTALMRAFLPLAFERYRLDYCVIGPSKSNIAAIRSYEKAGFRHLKEYREEDTIDPPHLLLDIRRSEIERPQAR